MKIFVRPLFLFAAPAALIASGSIGREGLLYDRAAILGGEWWRLWTGHWVHFSTSHLAWNLAVLLGAGTWLERIRPGWLARLAGIGTPLISLGLLAFAPSMASYGGLSGLATGVLVLLALSQAKEFPAERGWWFAVLILTAGKTALDAVSGAALFTQFGSEGIRPSALAHLLGAFIAAACLSLHCRQGQTVGPTVPEEPPDTP